MTSVRQAPNGQRAASPIECLKIAIFGLGRSGLAIGLAAMQLGAEPHVFDEKPLEALPKRDLYDEALAADLPVTLGWSGEFIDAAWDLVVLNPAVPRTHPKIEIGLTHGLKFISEVEFAYRISKAPIVAITGTNGKSTTTVMTMLCLRACGEDAVLCGNIFGSGFPEIPLTEAALHSTPDQILVAEISSFQLEWIDEFRPAVAGITNITPDHLDRYPSFDEYAATKLRIFENQTRAEFAVVRANDPVVSPPGPMEPVFGLMDVEHETSPTVLTFGTHGQHARVDDLDLAILHRRIPFASLPFHEPHNFLNAGMAALLAYSALAWKCAGSPDCPAAKLLSQAEEEFVAGQTAKRSPFGARRPESGPLRVLPEQIVDGLKQFRGLAHRMEPLGEKAGVTLINNSMCTNPDAVIKSAQSVPARTHLLIGGVNKGLDFEPLAQYLAKHDNKPYLFGSDAVDLDNMLGGGYPKFATLREAFQAAVLDAKPGEVVMLAPGCASTDQYRDFRDRGEVFRTIAKEWLDS